MNFLSNPQRKAKIYLTFISEDRNMIFTVKVAYVMEVVKVKKLTKIYGRKKFKYQVRPDPSSVQK